MGNGKRVKQNNANVKIDSEKLDKLIGIIEELVVSRAGTEQLLNEFKSGGLKDKLEQESKIISELQNLVMKIRTVPLDGLFSKITREFAQTKFIISGREVEIERAMLEPLEEPLMNLVRGLNSIESIGRDKTSAGNLEIAATSDTNKVIISVSTELKSGNGDIAISEMLSAVETGIEAIGGNLNLYNAEERLTASIEMPMNTSITKCLLIEAGGYIFAIPLDYVETIISENSASSDRTNNEDVIVYRNIVMPRIDLIKRFGITGDFDGQKFYVIMKSGSKKTAIYVERLLGQRDLVIKPLGRAIGKSKDFVGASILGDGVIALVIDSECLFK